MNGGGDGRGWWKMHSGPGKIGQLLKQARSVFAETEGDDVKGERIVEQLLGHGADDSMLHAEKNQKRRKNGREPRTEQADKRASCR